MTTSIIGKMFLEAYNDKFGTKYNALTFFIEQFYPLFFDHNKYLMTAGNSPLENPKLSWEDMLKGNKPYETKEQRKVRYEKLIKRIVANVADASIARGYAAVDEKSIMSGQVTDMRVIDTIDDICLSWIGDALGTGVQGGYSILFYNTDILMDIYKGWQLYRKVLNDTEWMKGNQINTWNGQWLSHYYDERVYNDVNPLSNFTPYIRNNDGVISVETQKWTRLLIGIARRYKTIQIMGYVYNIGPKANKTIGFIPFNLSQIRKPIDLYNRLFGLSLGKLAEELWGTEFGFEVACTEGVIGTKAMEPKGLKAYISGRKQPQVPKSNEQIVSFNVYKIWILAMLNNNEMWDKTLDLARMLNRASCNKDKKISTKPENLVNNVLKAVNKKQFIEAVTEIVLFVDNLDQFKQLVREVHCMPSDNVPYFMTLLRFQYYTI